jgi:uncharacterized protein (TIGR01777 family)
LQKPRRDQVNRKKLTESCMKVLMTGSSGLVGTALTEALAREGHAVVRLVRSGSGKKGSGKSAHKEAGIEKSSQARDRAANTVDVAWNPNTCDLEGEPFGAEQEKVEGADAVVNLAGASIAGESWSEERKALLRSSRVHITRELLCALEKLSAPPKTLVSASAIGYYGNRGDEVLTEESKQGEDFLARLAQEWEAEAVKAEALGMRVVRTRFGIILANHGGALPQMMRPFQFFAGGKIGSGQQWMSWITLADTVGVLRLALANRAISGALNVVAPSPVRNAEFVRELGRAMHRPAILPAPAFALKFALGELAEALLLSSQRVMPSRLQQLGHKFQHADLPSALAAVLR